MIRARALCETHGRYEVARSCRQLRRFLHPLNEHGTLRRVVRTLNRTS